MSKDNVCRECSLSVDQSDELYTICEGYCASFFHIKCVGLSESEMDVLKANIIWLCDECLSQFMRARDAKEGTPAKQVVKIAANETSIDNEIRDLKDAVAEIRSAMSQFLPPSSTDDKIEPSFVHSTPVKPIQLHDGTKPYVVGNHSTVNTDQASPQQCIMETTDGKNFSLLLTHIDASVAESEVHRMVVAALGTQGPEYIDVVKLVPHWKRRDIIDFASFKVVLDGRWRSKAMDPSTWPQGIKFREFIKRRINTWKPV